MSRFVTREFVDAAICTAGVEHNGLRGGDAGHGGFVKIVIRMDGGDFELSYRNDYQPESEPVAANVIKFVVRGDAERKTLAAALHWIASELIENERVEEQP